MDRLGRFRMILLLGCGVLAACAEPPPPAAPVAAPPPAQPEGIYVVVARGQSLDTIAKAYRVAKRDLIAVNKLKPPFTVKAGTVLMIPGAAAKPPPSPQAAPKPKPVQPVAAKLPAGRQAAPPAERPARTKRPTPEVIPLD